MVFIYPALHFRKFERNRLIIRCARVVVLVCCLCPWPLTSMALGATDALSGLKRDQVFADFRVANVYSDPDGRIVGVKLRHVPSGAPVFVLRMETVPQAFIWVDAPDNSNKGLPHSLEHLLESKGTTGRYFKLLVDMRLSRSEAATAEDFNHYGFASGAGLDGFFELLHASLDALYHPDFTDAEAEQEFYHFGVATDPVTRKKTLVEQGSVYDEMQTGQGSFTYYFELNKRVLGSQSPFSFYSSGLPDEMRGVTPREIRDFHAQNYRLGLATGFIFALDPRENLFRFLSRVSDEFKSIPSRQPVVPTTNNRQPKYPIAPSADNEIAIYPFPGANDSDPGEMRFSWRSMETNSSIELRLLQLFFRSLADGERSLLYKSLIDSKTRELDSGATAVESEPFLANSPHFPVWNVGISGVPGSRISIQRVSDFRNLICARIREISEYPDDSNSLRTMNELAMSYALGWRRAENVWVKNAPDFGVRGAGFTWKQYLDVLEMDSSFNRSISEQSVWQAVSDQLQSGKNIWRDLILKFHLLDLPYAAASVPSAQLLERLEQDKRNRIRQKLDGLLAQYHTGDEQQALAQFESDELAKTREIDRIEAKVRRPRFTSHPPLTWDDSIHYRQFTLAGGIPAVATVFARPPTIDLGLAFDLKQIPEKYYKYIPILPRCFDALGLKEGDHVTSYPDLLARIRTTIYDVSVSYEFDALARRADLAFRTSGTSVEEFRKALQLLRQIMGSNYLDMANADRLRDIVDQHLSFDDSFTKQGEEYWIPNPAYSFLHQDDPLFFSLNSQFTWDHWDWRLKWLLHKPVDARVIDALGNFANSVLASGAGDSRQNFGERLRKLNATGLEAELIDCWARNLSSFPDSERTEALRRLTEEVQQDLRTGPARTIEDLKQLQKMVLNRRALHLDLTLSQKILDQIRPDLTAFVAAIPASPPSRDASNHEVQVGNPVLAKLAKRYHFASWQFPLYVGLVHPDGVTGDVIFYSHAPGYPQVDRKSLIEGLARNLLSGLGPQSFHMKASETGLAYSSSLSNDPSEEYAWYYADRVPDVTALVQLVNATAAKVPNLQDPFVVDYALRQTFAIPRSMNTFSQRGWAMAQDLRNGNTPEKIRRFSRSVLALKHDPRLLFGLTSAGFDSICGVLLNDRCREQHKSAHSIFFFIGPDGVLSDAEKRLSIPNLLRIWPADYWMD